MGGPKLLHYVASKGAVISMTRSMARELGADGNSVNSIAPGLTELRPRNMFRRNGDVNTQITVHLPEHRCLKM